MSLLSIVASSSAFRLPASPPPKGSSIDSDWSTKNKKQPGFLRLISAWYAMVFLHCWHYDAAAGQSVTSSPPRPTSYGPPRRPRATRRLRRSDRRDEQFELRAAHVHERRGQHGQRGLRTPVGLQPLALRSVRRNELVVHVAGTIGRPGAREPRNERRTT